MLKKVISIFGLLLALSLFCNCATTNCYTAETLEDGETILTPGLDNIISASYSKNNDTNTYWALQPALGISHGLPRRFEMGLRYHIPIIIEGQLRHQLTPRDFPITLSLNLHPIILPDDDAPITFLKYGATLGFKGMMDIEPFIGYYIYSSKIKLDISDYKDKKEAWSILNLGLGIPWRDNTIIPEFNFLFPRHSIKEGLIFFGIGIRSPLRSKSK